MNSLDVLPATKYRFVREYPLESLPVLFAEHRRMSLFIEKGTSCSKCDKQFTRLIHGVDSKKNLHIDLYTDDLSSLLTVAHIIPSSSGGLKSKNNTRPLCKECNSKEKNGFDHILADRDLFHSHCYLWVVRKKCGGKFPSGKSTNVIQSIFLSPRHQVPYFGFVDRYTYPATKVVFTTSRFTSIEEVQKHYPVNNAKVEAFS
jgi:hypothetical protein